MSTVVTVEDDGKEVMYFRINEDHVERPDKPAIHAPEVLRELTVEDQVIAAIQAIQREDDKWQTLTETPTGLKYPTLGELDS